MKALNCWYQSETDTWYMRVPFSFDPVRMKVAREMLLKIEVDRCKEARAKGQFDKADYFKKRAKALFEGRFEQVVAGGDGALFQSTMRMNPDKIISFPAPTIETVSPTLIMPGDH